MSRTIRAATPLTRTDRSSDSRGPKTGFTRTPRNRTAAGRPSTDPQDVSAKTARRQRLDRFQPTIEARHADTLRPTVTDLVLGTPYVNDQVDRTRLSILYRYAAHHHTATGFFEPTRHLQDEHLVDYWRTGCTGLTPRSRDKALSALRSVATGCTFADGLLMRRVPTSAPYTDVEWAAIRRAADRLTEPDWRLAADTLLDLSGETGLRGSEINAAVGTDLGLTDGRLLIRVRSIQPERVRTVPLDRTTSERLSDRVSDLRHLLRPDYRNRKNVVSALITSLGRRDVTFAGFRAARARHRWIANLLQQPIDLSSVMYLAGLESDSHTLHDISTHLRPTEPAHAVRAYDLVQRHAGAEGNVRELADSNEYAASRETEQPGEDGDVRRHPSPGDPDWPSD